jgi:hypothetical protein
VQALCGAAKMQRLGHCHKLFHESQFHIFTIYKIYYSQTKTVLDK